MRAKSTTRPVKDVAGIPQPILEAAQQKLIQAATEAILTGRKPPLLHSFVLGDNTHARAADRFYFTTGHKPPNIKPPHWFRYFEGLEVWKAGEKVGEFLDYTAFKLIKIKVLVKFKKNNDEAFWIDGLEKEPTRVRTYSTLASEDFWKGWGRIPDHVLDFMSQWLLVN